jgi:hypothetical protein
MRQRTETNSEGDVEEEAKPPEVKRFDSELKKEKKESKRTDLGEGGKEEQRGGEDLLRIKFGNRLLVFI